MNSTDSAIHGRIRWYSQSKTPPWEIGTYPPFGNRPAL